MQDSRLLEHLRDRQEAMLAELRTLVEIESPSRDNEALGTLANVLANRLETLGGKVEKLAGPHLLTRFGDDSTERPILILGHFDTVWPIGTLTRQPFCIADVHAFGPGIYDMKASLVMIFAAIEAFTALKLPSKRPLIVLLTCDEEIGSPSSRRLIEETAKQADCVLVVEPALEDGALKTARKGVGGFTILVTGKSAHAGVEPEKGVNAILELSNQIVKIHALANPAAGTTVSVGTITGGTTPNVVPASATACIDVRASTMAEAARIEREFFALQPILTGASLKISGGFNRPPMERTAAVADLFHRAREIGRTVGLELTEGSTGGGSDGNFTAALGVPTLDGLGSIGAGAHAVNEQIVIASLAERTALLACLLQHL